MSPRIITPLGACIIMMMSSLFSGCDSGNPLSLQDALTGVAGTITTGPWTQAADASLPPGGGTVTVSNSGHPVTGLTITVQEGSYNTPQRYVVSYAEITGHKLGPSFNPVSPMISIDNGGGFSETFIRVRIPLTVSADRPVMAFYYDPQTGEIEGIMTLSRTTEFLEIAVRHFSLIVVSEYHKDWLIQGGGYTSLFDPAVNGWSFVNEGTYPRNGGNCAGMSIGAAYFFKNFTASVSIRSHFDNDQLWFQTPSLWQDDAGAHKFVTAIQALSNSSQRWLSNNNVTTLLAVPAEESFWNLLYAMVMTNQPQPLYLDKRNDAAAPAHMILAIGYVITPTEATIRVYDPNFPGLTGEIVYSLTGKAFHPYTSAANAEAIRQGAVYHFDIIQFIPYGTTVSNAEISRLFRKVADRSIAGDLFPEYRVYAVQDKTNPSSDEIELLDAAGGKTNVVPFDEFDIVVRGPWVSASWEYTTYRKLKGDNYTVWSPMQRISIGEDDELYGLLLKGRQPTWTSSSWAGFHWYKISRQKYRIDPQEASGAAQEEVTFTARTFGSKPVQARYEWDFGDHTAVVTVMQDSVVRHAFKENGVYDITLTVHDVATNTRVAVAYARASIGSYTRLKVGLGGVIHMDDGSTMGSMNFWNTWGVVTPITWTGNEFSVTHVTTVDAYVETTTMQGRLSSDRKMAEMLDCTYSFRAKDHSTEVDAYLHLYDVPLFDTTPGTLKVTLAGTAAQKVTSSYQWEERSYDNGTLRRKIRIANIDFSLQSTTLTVEFTP